MTDPTLLDRASDAADLLEEIVADRGLLTGIDPVLLRRLLIAAGRASHPTQGEMKALRRGELA